MQAQLNKESDAFRFRAIFYNRMKPGTSYKNNVPPTLVARAAESNPDPSLYVPVAASGFADLQERIKAQEKAREGQDTALASAQTTLRTLQQKLGGAELRLEQQRRRQQELGARLLSASVKLERLRARGCAIQGREEDYRAAVASLQLELDKPQQFKGRLHELYAQQRLREERERVASSGQLPSLEGGELGTVHGVLGEHQKGLTFLAHQLSLDLRTLDTLLRTLH